MVNQCKIRLFADDTKIFRTVQSDLDRISLQADIDALYQWSLRWQLPFNLIKCKAIHFEFNNPMFQYFIGDGDSRVVIQTGYRGD